MICHTQKKNVPILTLKIDNVVIERVAELNFLGLTLDEHLTWKCHLNKYQVKFLNAWASKTDIKSKIA